METLERHSVDDNFLLFEMLLPQYIYNAEEEEKERERRKLNLALNDSVSAALHDQSFQPHNKLDTPKRVDDSIAGSFYAFPAYRKVLAESEEDGVIRADSRNQTISNHINIDRSLVKKESSTYLFQTAQG